MFWLRAAVRLGVGVSGHLAEADEGVHLVEVAADLGFEAMERGYVVVYLDFEEVPVGL